MRTALVDATTVDDGQVQCQACGDTARALPGESYGVEDRPLFNELEATLREAGLTPLNAIQLAVTLDSRISHPGLGLKRIAQSLPSRSILELIATNELTGIRKAEGMLTTLLEAIATGRSKSGWPAAPTARGPRQGTGSG